MKLRHLGFIALAMIATRADAAEPPLQLMPSGQWIADFAEDSCALRRTFSDGTDTVAFEMRQFAPDTGVLIAVTSNSLDDRRAAPRTHFLPDDGEPRRHEFYRAVSNDEGWKGVAVDDALSTAAERELSTRQSEGYVNSVAAREQRENSISGYFVGAAFKRDFVLQIGSLREPMKLMRVCLDDLLKSWGLDPAVQVGLTRSATTDFNQRWMGPIIRAQADLARGANISSARALLVIDEGGKATDCRLLEGVAEQAGAEKFCEAVIERARFTPALDAAGQPVKSYFLWYVALRRRTSVRYLG